MITLTPCSRSGYTTKYSLELALCRFILTRWKIDSKPKAFTPYKKSMTSSVINGRYEVKERIGAGSFGVIFKGYDREQKCDVALKLESTEILCPQLAYEYNVYRKLANTLGIPEVYDYYSDYELTSGKFNVLVMQLLGPSIEDLYERCGKRFTVKTTLQLAIQLVGIIESIHNKTFIHRDLKPDNFMLHVATKKVYIIDFGLAKRYRDPTTHAHIPYCDNKSLTGTPRYASINNHLGIQSSRRDDLEALDYILLYFLRGSLPWQGAKARSKKHKYQKIMEKKLATPIDIIHKGYPIELQVFAEYARSLRFADKPDYPYLIRLFKDAADRLDITLDEKYDWDVLLNPITENAEEEEDVEQASNAAQDVQPPNLENNSSLQNTKNPGTKPEDE